MPCFIQASIIICPMEYPFTKMQGAGNDFVVFDTFAKELRLSREQIKRIADRRFGIGCDQILLLGPADDADACYRVYNPDGGEVAQCGNGARCAALYLRGKGLVDKDEIDIATRNGRLLLKVDGSGDPIVNMGIPRFEPDEIPARFAQRQTQYRLSINDQQLHVSALSIGNPHAVMRVDDIDATAVEHLGPAIQGLDVFPEGVNVGFMQILDRQAIRLRVYERGAGETPACGSGACAAVIAGCTQGLLEGIIGVQARGGQLTVSWDGDGQAVWLQGPATITFDGTIDL